MRNLVLFFVKYSPVFLFVIYITAGCFLLFKNNPYQHHIYLTSANSVSSSLYKFTNNINGYFNLKNINEDLLLKNNDLELELLSLRSRIKELEEQSLDTLNTGSIWSDPRYSFTIAHVINNSTIHARNYITIDKGKQDGIEPEMGVVDQNGIIGIVNIVGDHSARVISLLNDQFRLSCKVKGHEYVGSLIWNGEKSDEAILEELPRHSLFEVGDTIVTSGFSTVFPEGILVGKVIEGLKDYDENFYALRVKLFTNHETLSSVRVIKDNMRDEIKNLDQDNLGTSTL